MEADNSLPSSMKIILIQMKLVHKLLKIMWDLCCVKWDRDRFFFEYFLFSCHNLSTKAPKAYLIHLPQKLNNVNNWERR